MIWTSILSCCLLLGATLSASEPQMGIEGVITGRALYDGRLDLAAALNVAAAAS